MKIRSTKIEVILGTLINKEENVISVKSLGEFKNGALVPSEEVFELPMTEKAAENFDKCNVEEGSFISLSVVDGKVENFRFKGRYRLSVDFPKKDNPEEVTTGELNIFIGMAARVTPFEKMVQVSLPVQKKEGTDWYALNFWKGTSEENPVDLGEKALLELQVPEGEKKPVFVAITGGGRKYTDKKGIERASYSVRHFAVV